MDTACLWWSRNREILLREAGGRAGTMQGWYSNTLVLLQSRRPSSKNIPRLASRSYSPNNVPRRCNLWKPLCAQCLDIHAVGFLPICSRSIPLFRRSAPKSIETVHFLCNWCPWWMRRNHVSSHWRFQKTGSVSKYRFQGFDNLPANGFNSEPIWQPWNQHWDIYQAGKSPAIPDACAWWRRTSWPSHPAASAA